MDRADDQPPLSVLGGQLKLGLMEESQKETHLEEILAFVRGLFSYLQRRAFAFLLNCAKVLLSGFTLSSYFKFWLSRKFVRQKGQLSFPFAHATLVGVSLSLLVTTGGLGEFLYQKTSPVFNDFGAAILESKTELSTEQSKLTRTDSFTYTVQEGENLYEIAKRFTRTPDDLASANNLKISEGASYNIYPGQVLTIPHLDGFYHEVKSGDTVERLARFYRADPQSIVELNYLFGSYAAALEPGTKLFVPTITGAALSTSALASSSGSCGPLKNFGWPTKSKALVGGYTSSHRAIDLAAQFEELLAPADGTVVAAGGSPKPCFSFGPGCNYGYGGYVFIDLGDGYQVRYAHISQWKVSAGQKVSKGDTVAISGESGVAYGPHLHFELFCNGTKINPLPYLP
ncbi:hypothetical protein A2797_02635 [candidate division WWE3 bacterium RIFCSPHIGHO2_01_FULL_48_15]|uniref:LysM domain-containing protein n=1 Tax=candidate division WWE3 bacterium RIFCSPHIGHO2_01_FULL_48_15 TaxID=1802619 RepID=A0A1F4VA30_UNCKA|nr:MAG: hypothetical protein A2797_02635 [candidate division WWE3 bacterium RIFCSPHIGHO2_01_FULL_48_15]